MYHISRILSSLVFSCRFYYILKNSKIIFAAVPFKQGASEELRKNTKGRVVLNHPGSVHSFEEYWLSNYNKPLSYKENLSLYVNYCNQFDKILFQAEDQANECANKAPCLKSLPIVIKPTCDEKTVLRALNSKTPYDQKDFNIVNIGSIQSRKAQEFSIQAFDLFLRKETNSNVKLHFVGTILDMGYYKEIYKMIQTLGLEDKVFFYQNRTDYLRFIAHADILLQSSRSEGVSRVLRESMLLKVPIVSFKISGTKDILSHENNEAFLAKPFDTEELAIGIEKIHFDKKYKSDLKSNAFEKYVKYYSSVKYASAWIDALNNII
jgi:glycosyltransferase involved in cell wall biosynthesis